MCLNFALGMAHIPDTPISIQNAYTAIPLDPNDPSGPKLYETCYYDYEQYGLIQKDNDANSPTHGEWVLIKDKDPDGVPNSGDEVSSLSSLVTNLNNTGYDPITQAVEGTYQSIVTLKDFLLGGYIVNVIDHIVINCDMDKDSPTYGQPVSTDVWNYFKAGVHMMFGILLALTIFYLVTGKSFGI